MEFPIVASHHRLHCSSQYHLGVDRARERERWRTFSPLLDELLERRRRHVAEAIEQGLLALSQVRRLDERILGRLARELGVKVSHVLDALLFCGGMVSESERPLPPPSLSPSRTKWGLNCGSYPL